MSRLEQIENIQKSTSEAGRGMDSRSFPLGMHSSMLGTYPMLSYSNPLSQTLSLQDGLQQGGGGTLAGQATTSLSKASGVSLGGVTLIRSHPGTRHQDNHGKGGGGLMSVLVRGSPCRRMALIPVFISSSLVQAAQGDRAPLLGCSPEIGA